MNETDEQYLKTAYEDGWLEEEDIKEIERFKRKYSAS